ncbi:MAG: NTP transferase domain-containing protein [Candidatus Moranbacteria bacterium]|nr:NTP transferase domain-containing protein [Candidatus Moranbacteria bacterium]
MQAVILAAGKGTRLRPVTNQTPKILLPVTNTKKVIDFLIQAIPDKVEEFIVVVNHLEEQIKQAFKKKLTGKKKLTFVRHKKLDGTAKALWQCKEKLKKSFLVLNGDDIYQKKDLVRLAEQELAILAVRKKGKPTGGVIKTDQKHKLISIIDYPNNTKAKSWLLNTGAYKLNQKIFNFKPTRISDHSQEFGLPQTIANMAKKHKVKVVETENFYQINTVEDWEKFQKIQTSQSFLKMDLV